MTILQIENRTENWRTAEYFSSFFGDRSYLIARHLGADPVPRPGEVRLELFWKGMRDQIHRSKQRGRPIIASDLVEIYKMLFPELQGHVREFQGFKPLPKSYGVTTDAQKADLVNNLSNTEIDIVLETPHHLFIGEAKHEMSFGANGNLVLVHQLIRQFVMAKILVEISGIRPRKRVIPFIVGDRPPSLKKTSQVKFMIRREWLQEDNILSWDFIKSLDQSS